MCVYGLFKSSAEYAQELFLKTGSSEFPSSPGVLALSYPYEGVVIVIDASCPARYLNCIQGRLTPDKKQLTHNVIIEMDPNPMILATDPNKGLQAMFKIKCITDISADNECVSYYGAAYYATTQKNLISFVAATLPDAIPIDATDYSDDSDTEDNKKTEEKKQPVRETNTSSSRRKSESTLTPTPTKKTRTSSTRMAKSTLEETPAPEPSPQSQASPPDASSTSETSQSDASSTSETSQSDASNTQQYNTLEYLEGDSHELSEDLALEQTINSSNSSSSATPISGDEDEIQIKTTRYFFDLPCLYPLSVNMFVYFLANVSLPQLCLLCLLFRRQ